jgi:hypothetical protein
MRSEIFSRHWGSRSNLAAAPAVTRHWVELRRAPKQRQICLPRSRCFQRDRHYNTAILTTFYYDAESSFPDCQCVIQQQ